MSTITDLYRQRRAASVAHCAPPAPACSTCGMLECVCRPRFFAGQVLTADDLNRLDAYIRAKHRLHNRQLHGWGVVNGLEVTCAPCGDGVTVSCGYALSPCGEDIVVCDSTEVDVCALITHCEEPVPRCDPPRRGAARRCPEDEQEWVLAIRYAESPTRGVLPLYGRSESACGCGNSGCGGAAAGCGCGGRKAIKCTCAPKPRGAPVQCEPTVICEGHAFEVYRAPAPANDDKRGGHESELLERLRCCIEALLKGAPPQPAEPITGNAAAWRLWALRFQQHLLGKLRQRPGVNCALLDRLEGLVIPPLADNNTAALAAAIQLLFVVFIDALMNCFCSALLPPCPLPSEDERVALATLHVAMNPCRVLRVCNWSTQRRIAVTMPALEYWLGTFPFIAALRELLQKACCFDLAALLREREPTQPGVASTRAAADIAQDRATLRLNPTLDDPAALQGFSRSLMQSMFTPGGTITPDLLAEGLLSGKGNLPLAADALPQWLLMNQLARPMGGIVGSELLAVLGGSAVDTAPSSEPPPDDAADAAALRESVAALAARVDAQQAEIAALRKSRSRKS